MTDSGHALMLSGVVQHCPDCAGERIFVEPQLLDLVGELACTDCGAAVLDGDPRPLHTRPGDTRPSDTRVADVRRAS